MGSKAGLWVNIHNKRARIAAGSNEKMRTPGAKGAPTQASIKKSAKKPTVKKRTT